jgi:hypothetical protein
MTDKWENFNDDAERSWENETLANQEEREALERREDELERRDSDRGEMGDKQ